MKRSTLTCDERGYARQLAYRSGERLGWIVSLDRSFDASWPSVCRPRPSIEATFAHV